MLAPDARLEALDPRHWHNAMRLLLPPRALARPRYALGIVEDGRLVAATVAGVAATGVTDVALPTCTAAGGAAWAQVLGVGCAVVIERGLAEDLLGTLEPTWRLGDPLPALGVAAWQALRPRVGRGVWTYPDLLPLLPAPPYAALASTFDRLFPDGTTLAAYVLEDDHRRIHASVLAEKRGGQVVRVTTHAALADLIDEAAVAAAGPRGAAPLLAAITQRLSRPSLLVILDRSTWSEILDGPGDLLAREVAAGRVRLDPAPAWLLALLGGTAVAATATRGARALAAWLPASVVDQARGLATAARDAARGVGADPFALLGFDPLALWAQVRPYYRTR